MSTDAASAQPSRTFAVSTAPPTAPSSDPAPAAAAEAQWPPPDEHVWLTFPPFPKAPPGATLVPFGAFKPGGILQAAEGEQERDALGIPTVALRVHHDLTAMERRKRKKTRVDANGAVRRVLWFEDWADGEELRRTAGVIDPSLPRIDRLHQAAYDFKHGRPLASNQELSHLWDRWRLYIGLISGLQAPASRKKNAAMRDAFAALAEADADDGDDDDEEDMPVTRPPKEASVLVDNDEGKPPRPLPSGEPKPGVTEEQRQQRREYYREVRDTKMDRFLNDPEKAVKIFLSGYFRDRGMSFSEKFCRDGPIMLAFFLNFLLRNRVFPESEKDLRKALAVAEQARRELPHAFVISRAVPDDFNNGCVLLFGTMTFKNVWDAPGGDAASSGDEGAPEAKRQKTEAAILQEAAGPAEIEVVTADTVREMEEEAKDALPDVDVNGEQAEGATWGAPPEAGEAAGESWGDANAAWGAPEDPMLWDTTPKTNPLTAYVGPTALPLTHTTGIIERSTRRVKAVVLPRATPSAQKKGAKKSVASGTCDGPSAEAVERDLEARLAQVVLAPWEEWDLYDKADVTKPEILADSRGPVIREENGEPDPAPSAEGAPPPHNPFKDEITVLVDPAAAEKLWLGTGIESTWVQLARADMSAPVDADGSSKQKGAPGEPVAPTKFWYMEKVMAVLPSFHTEMVPLPTTQDVFGPEE